MFCAALLPAAFGCGISTYNIRFVPDEKELKGKASIPVYVYFAPEHDVKSCTDLTSAKLFDDSELYESRMNRKLLKSTVVSADAPVRIVADDFPDAVVKVFVWGNFTEKTEEGGDKLVIEPDRFQKASFMSGEGLLEIPVHPFGFGTPR